MTSLSFSSQIAARLATSLFPAWLLLTACGDAAPKYPDVGSFCDARAKAECNDEVVKACAVVDVTTCINNRRSACIAATPPSGAYSSKGAEDCVSAVSAAFSDAKLTSDENRSMNGACALVFDGPGSANAACTTDPDCKVSAGLRCVVPGGAAKGTCQVPERVQGGGSCTSPNQLCVDGFHCGSSQHCDINGQVGDACSATLPCVATALCSGGGACVNKSNDGTICMSDDMCLHGICARGTTTTQGLCVAQETLAPNEPFCIDAR